MIQNMVPAIWFFIVLALLALLAALLIVLMVIDLCACNIRLRRRRRSLSARGPSVWIDGAELPSVTHVYIDSLESGCKWLWIETQQHQADIETTRRAVGSLAMESNERLARKIEKDHGLSAG